jgi:sugar lactone lactonase YvrE
LPGPRVLVTGLGFGESQRWHDGRLWFSGFGSHEVVAVDLEGNSEVIARVPGMPMGLGFLPDGNLLVVSARDGRLLIAEPGGRPAAYADLTGLAGHPWSDMVVDGRGNACVGNIGFDFPAGEFVPGIVALVTPGGAARQAAGAISFANGMAITPGDPRYSPSGCQ